MKSLRIAATFLMLAVVAAAAPLITSLSPTRGLASEATSAVITGRDFGVNPSVTFNGGVATVTFSTVSKPIDSGGDLAVVVVAAGQASNLKIFRSVALTSLLDYYVDLPAEAVIPAPVGSYSANAGGSDLLTVPPGYTANGPAATSITPIPQIKLTAYSLGVGTAQSLSLETLASQNYGIFYTENLQDDVLLETVAGTGGVVSRAFDPLVSATSKRFYIVAPVQ